MLELELEVMLVGVRSEADFLDHNLRGVLLHLLGLLALLIEILLVVQNLADGRIRLGADLNKIELEFVGQGLGLGDRVNPLLRDVVSYETDLRGRDLSVDAELVLIFVLTGRLIAATGFRSRTCRLGSVRRCDKKILLNLVIHN